MRCLLVYAVEASDPDVVDDGHYGADLGEVICLDGMLMGVVEDVVLATNLASLVLGCLDKGKRVV